MGYVRGVNKFPAIALACLRYSLDDAKRLEEKEMGAFSNAEQLDKLSLTRRSEWIVSRFLLKQLLGAFSLSAEWSKNAEYGFPELRDPETKNLLPWQVSWSHTERFAVAALSRFSVGIDAEPFSRSVEKILNRVASSEEVQAFCPPRFGDREVDPPLALWCAKEAAAKATGLGMRWGLKNFEVGPERENVWEVKVLQEGPRRFHQLGVRFVEREGCLLAIACERAQLLGPRALAFLL